MNPDTPWTAYDVPALTRAFSQGPNVVLVLGAPSPHALAPLLRSSTFVHSLILLVTNVVPTRSALAAAAASAPSHAAIRVLRLSEPLAPGAPTFALALVAVLESAAAVARAWRSQVVAAPPLPGSGPDIIQLGQGPDGSFSVAEPLVDPGNPSPPLSNDHLHTPGTAKRRSTLAPSNNPYPAGRTRPPSALSVATSNSGRSGFFFSSERSLNKKPSSNLSGSKRLSVSSKRLSSSAPKASATDNSRAFDALISFLPAAQPEKAVLKHVVLVSTLTGSFLSGPSFGMLANTNPSATTSYSYFGSLPGSRRGSVSSGIGNGSSPDVERPDSPSRSLKSTFNNSPPLSPPRTHASKSVPGSPRDSFHGGSTVMFAPKTTAHVVHVLPASYRSSKLTGALGAFLDSYSPTPSPLGARAPMKPQAYVMSERAMRTLEYILVGALEAEAPAMDDVKGKKKDDGVRMGRWVAGILVVKEEDVDAASGSDELEETDTTNVDGKTPYGLPTPPASRSGSGEDEETEVQTRKRTPSSSNGHAAHSPKKPKRHSTRQPASAVFPSTEKPLLRSPSGRRRVDSAPAQPQTATPPRPDPPALVIPKAPQSTLRPPHPSTASGSGSRTWGQRGSKFFGGKTANDFKLSPPDVRGRSSPDLRDLGKRRRRWWAFWS
uniref:Uncharacterized protein n=1 Tax=Mycena chlorophos TaxID=658473 RepID=A0ABQ0M7L2_MYCCL|nr:predicted protein [Mycena chlorophos]